LQLAVPRWLGRGREQRCNCSVEVARWHSPARHGNGRRPQGNVHGERWQDGVDLKAGEQVGHVGEISFVDRSARTVPF
jgi:hypothetical protein